MKHLLEKKAKKTRYKQFHQQLRINKQGHVSSYLCLSKSPVDCGHDVTDKDLVLPNRSQDLAFRCRVAASLDT